MKRLSLLLGVLLVAAGLHTVRAQTAQPPAAGPAPAAAPAQGKSTVIERVIVRVNGEILTQSELTQRQIDVLRDSPTKPTSDAELQAELDKLTPSVLVESVDDLLLVQRGREMGAKYTDEEFKQSIEEIKKQNKFDDAQLKAALQQEGLTMEQLRQQFERLALKRTVQQREIGPSLTITLEEQRQYYQKHPDQFMSPATVTLRELFVAIPTSTVLGKDAVNPADEAAALAKIQGLRTRAIGGEDFAKLVTDNSDAASKATGGMIGPVNIADVNPVLKDAIDKLQPGGVTEPMKGAKGYQIFKLETRSAQQLRPFDLVRDQISSAIRTERIEPETQKMLARLRTQAVIEWKDEKYREIYEKRTSQK